MLCVGCGNISKLMQVALSEGLYQATHTMLSDPSNGEEAGLDRLAHHVTARPPRSIASLHSPGIL